MKKTLATILIFTLLICTGADCPFKGKDGKDGTPAAAGTSTVISTKVYEFTPDSNPYTKTAPEVSITALEAGLQTVEVFVAASPHEWEPMPVVLYFPYGPIDFSYYLTSQAIIFEAYHQGSLFVHPATFNYPCLVVIKNYSKAAIISGSSGPP